MTKDNIKTVNEEEKKQIEQKILNAKKALKFLKLTKTDSISKHAIIDNKEKFDEIIKSLEEITGWAAEDEEQMKKEKRILTEKEAEGKTMENQYKKAVEYIDELWKKHHETIEAGAKIALVVIAAKGTYNLLKGIFNNKKAGK